MSVDTVTPLLSPPQDKEPRGIIPLENLEVREWSDGKRNVSAVAPHSPLRYKVTTKKVHVCVMLW